MLQECAKEQECAKYTLKMQITPFMLCHICFVLIVHVLECTLKNLHAKFGGHRYCNKCFRSKNNSKHVALGKCNSVTGM